MSAPQVLPHRDAVRDALEAAGLTVGVGGRPADPPDRYVVLYFDPGRSVAESLADERTDLQALFQVTCVAPTEEQCLWLTGRVREALHGPLVVPGRVVWRPEELGGPPVARDDDVTPPLFFLPVQYRLQSTTA